MAKNIKKHGSSLLDMAFVMDCTGSMSPYIETALNNIQKIVETIDAEKNIDVHLALVEYRDHPPQEDTFVTRVHDFSDSVAEMKKWLEDCSADGGGDTPEAVADGLHALLKLDWCVKSTKIAILICDAPPHGLKTSGDGFPDGCPAGLDPLAIVRELTEKGITLYVVGCEPALVCYKEFFMGLAYATGGQYLPLAGTRALTLIIIGGAQEELSLDHLMEEVDRDVMEEAQLGECGDEEEIASRIHAKMIGKGYKAKKLMRNKKAMGSVSKRAQVFSKMTRLSQMEKFLPLPDDYSDTEARDDDEYEAVEETLDIVQIKRMVKKSMARNKVVLPDIVSLREEVLRLRQRIDDLEQNFRRTCLKCCGVPQTEGYRIKIWYKEFTVGANQATRFSFAFAKHYSSKLAAWLLSWIEESFDLSLTS